MVQILFFISHLYVIFFKFTKNGGKNPKTDAEFFCKPHNLFFRNELWDIASKFQTNWSDVWQLPPSSTNFMLLRAQMFREDPLIGICPFLIPPPPFPYSQLHDT